MGSVALAASAATLFKTARRPEFGTLAVITVSLVVTFIPLSPSFMI
jgi:hypothetical protein